MDPNCTLINVFTAIADGDLDTAEQHARELDAWLHRGGFSPDAFGEASWPKIMPFLLRSIASERAMQDRLTDVQLIDKDQLVVWVGSLAGFFGANLPEHGGSLDCDEIRSIRDSIRQGHDCVISGGASPTVFLRPIRTQESEQAD